MVHVDFWPFSERVFTEETVDGIRGDGRLTNSRCEQMWPDDIARRKVSRAITQGEIVDDPDTA